MPRTYKTDLAGLRFGRLTVEAFVPDDSRHSRWIVRCDCGQVKTTLAQSFTRGLTLSCGCLQRELTRERGTTHGQAGAKVRTKAYRVWANMMDRCEWGGNERAFKDYGARGIRVCQEWHTFDGFFADMGIPPSGATLDRMDNDGPYSPTNCRWATRLEQALNTSRTRRVLFDDAEWTVYQLCERLGLSRKAVRARAARRGNSYAAALKSLGFQCVVDIAPRRGAAAERGVVVYADEATA